MEDSTKVTLEFTREEALVLFEWAARYSETRILSIEDQAEQRVLWNILCMLETMLHEPFMQEYSELLAQARNNVRDPIID